MSDSLKELRLTYEANAYKALLGKLAWYLAYRVQALQVHKEGTSWQARNGDILETLRTKEFTKI